MPLAMGRFLDAYCYSRDLDLGKNVFFVTQNRFNRKRGIFCLLLRILQVLTLFLALHLKTARESPVRDDAILKMGIDMKGIISCFKHELVVPERS